MILMKREKLFCCNVIVMRDRCTVSRLRFQALYLPLAKKKKQCANKTHFSALVIIWWDPRHLLYMNYKIYKILNTTFLSLGKLQICHFKMSHNNSYRLYVYKKPFWPLCLLTVFPWPVSFLKLHSFPRKKEKKGGKRKKKREV